MEESRQVQISGESYFFRDEGQFTVLRERILPELLEARRKQFPLRPLRIWSAGCSTGEEPYSLAMLLDEMLPRRESGNIVILATDNNEKALEKARRGIYTEWSFRMVGSDVKRRYFRKRRSEWELIETIRKRVKFQTVDLIKDAYPCLTPEINHMDLIICRNVFIYLDSEAVATVVTKFRDTLTLGGYLITGHGELHGQELGLLRPKLFPESVVYRKAHQIPDCKLLIADSGQSAIGNSVPAIHGLQSKIHNPASGIKHTKSIIPGSRSDIRDRQPEIRNHYSMAQVYADSGEYDKAACNCKMAIAGDPMAANPYFLLAHIVEAQGDHETAKSLLKKAIYLSPAFVAAYLELGALYEKENDSARARRMRTTAMKILEALPPHAFIEPYNETTAREVLQCVKKTLEHGEE